MFYNGEVRQKYLVVSQAKDQEDLKTKEEKDYQALLKLYLEEREKQKALIKASV